MKMCRKCGHTQDMGEVTDGDGVPIAIIQVKGLLNATKEQREGLVEYFWSHWEDAVKKGMPLLIGEDYNIYVRKGQSFVKVTGSDDALKAKE